MGLVLTNIFVGFNEKGLLASPNKPVIYFHYIDNAFCLLNNETEADLFFNSINKIRSALKFTLDKETDYMLPFLDVLLCGTPLHYVTLIYRNSTSTGFYTRWDSFYLTN